MLSNLFARKYLFSPKSHSVINWIAGISVVSFAMPVAAMVILLSILNGFSDFARTMSSSFDADATILPREGQTFRIEDLDSVALTSFGEVTFFLEQQVLLEHDGTQTTATLRGVDDNYANVFPIREAITSGSWEVRLGDFDRLVMGRSLARELGIRTITDTEVNVYAVRRGSFSTLLPVDGYDVRRPRVTGLFSVDAESEQAYALTSLRAARQLFHRHGDVSAAAIKLTPPKLSPAAKHPRGVTVEELRTVVDGDTFVVKSREEMNATFHRLVSFEKWGVFFISLLVLILASFSIVGTLVMLMIDKRTDMWTLRALGGDTRLVRSIFIREGWLIGGLGGAIGLVLGVGFCLVQQHFGVIRMPIDSLLVQSYPVRLQGVDLLIVTAAFAVVVGIVSRLTVVGVIKRKS